MLLPLQVNSAGFAVCRCDSGWKHAPNSDTIDGYPIRASSTKGNFASPPRSSFGEILRLQYQCFRIAEMKTSIFRLFTCKSVHFFNVACICITGIVWGFGKCMLEMNKALFSWFVSASGTLHNRLGNNHVAVSNNRNRFRQSSSSSSFQGDPCSQGVCGANADCRSQGSRAVSAGKEGHNQSWISH